MNRVLLLNLDYEPLNICDLPRAIKLLINDKAETLHYKDHKYFYSGNGDRYSVPSVIRLKQNVRRKHNTSFKVSRGGIYGRDNYTCQYCGIRNIDLTLDHVYPRHLGGNHTWDNLVTCCRSCNIKKAGKTLEKSGMRLLSKPNLPVYSFYHLLCSYKEKDSEYWDYYLVR